MSIGIITVKDNLEDGFISMGKDCHLCGEMFTVGLYDTDTICPRCKELWQKIIKESSEE